MDRKVNNKIRKIETIRRRTPDRQMLEDSRAMGRHPRQSHPQARAARQRGRRDKTVLADRVPGRQATPHMCHTESRDRRTAQGHEEPPSAVSHKEEPPCGKHTGRDNRTGRLCTVCGDKCCVSHRSQCVYTHVRAQGVRRACVACARCTTLCVASLRVACCAYHFVSFRFVSFHLISFHFIHVPPWFVSQGGYVCGCAVRVRDASCVW